MESLTFGNPVPGAVGRAFAQFSGKIRAEIGAIAVEKCLEGNRYHSEGAQGSLLGVRKPLSFPFHPPS